METVLHDLVADKIEQQVLKEIVRKMKTGVRWPLLSFIRKKGH